MNPSRSAATTGNGQAVLKIRVILCDNIFVDTKHIFSRLFSITYHERNICKEELQSAVNKTFETCDNRLLIRYPSTNGGTTCTIKWFILDPINDDLHIFDITLGDSPSLSISLKDNVVKENTFTLNCDSKKVFKGYLR